MVVVFHILPHRYSQRLFPKEYQFVQALGFQAFHKSLGKGVLFRGLRPALDNCDSRFFQRPSELPREQRVSITDKIVDSSEEPVFGVRQIVGNLRHHLAIRLATNLGDLHFPFR